MACVAISAVTALAACGDDGDDASSSTDTAKLSTITALTESQYTAIKKVYVASLPLDDLDDIDEARVKRAVSSVVAACDQLDDDDPLLGEIEADVSGHRRAVRRVGRGVGCPDPAACADAFEAARRPRSASSDASRESDGRSTPRAYRQGCKKALHAARRPMPRLAALERASARCGRQERSPRTTALRCDARRRSTTCQPNPAQQDQLNRLRRNCH